MKNLNGRVAVVTGAAGGIGRALALELAERGCSLAVCDINAEGVQETARCVEAMGRRASVHRLDVADRTAMEALPQAVLDVHGRVDVVINNAGVALVDMVASMTLEDFEWLMGINFWGVVYGTRFFLPHLQRAGEGHIVNISSILGIVGASSQSAYCAAKFAVRGFTEALRAEMHGSGIGVTSVHPGGVDTDIVRSARFVRAHEADVDKKEMETRFKQAARTKPEAAARQVVDGIVRNRPRVMVGADAKFFDKLQRLMPVRYQGVLHWLLQRRT